MFPMEDGQRELPGLIEAELAEYRRSFCEAMKRQGAKEIAFYLPGEKGKRLKPESLMNQCRDWNHRKHPSADAAYVAQRLDLQHAADVAKLAKRVLGVVPRFAPRDSLQALLQKASKGFVSAAELQEIVAQTDFGDGP